MGTSATALGLGAGGKAASGAGVLTTGAGFDVFAGLANGGVAAFCATVTGAGGGELSAVSVTTAALVGLFDTGAAIGLGAFVSSAVVVAVVAVVAVIGAGAFGVACVTGPVFRLIANVEICARSAAMVVV